MIANVHLLRVSDLDWSSVTWSRFGRWSGMALLALGLLICSAQIGVAGEDDAVDFNRDIRPLLSDKCFKCHGPNETSRQGGFRLDDKESAFGEADSGEHPIVPGDLDQSELYQRITSDDLDMRMPPADSNKILSEDEIATIAKWIELGAPWQGHWAYLPPRKADLPEVRQQDWPHSPIDYFVLARLEKHALHPAPPADRITLIRRVAFDLTGLPPERAEVEQFLSDNTPGAYERLVDRLLASPHYGEQMARFWLDAVRYGDTHGLHLDNYREMWPYRDWVVCAYNANMPFDQFTIEQMAGDLLPNPTDDQIIATGLNRCNVTTNEGGSIEQEVYTRNVDDRVVTMGTVFLGATLECTRCHNHKFDPYTTKDFYSLFAYFNSIDGSPMDGNVKDHAPVIRVLTDQQKQQIAALHKQEQDLRAEIVSLLASTQYEEPADPTAGKTTNVTETVWVDDTIPPGAKAEGDWKWVAAPSPVLSGEKSSTRTATGLSQHFFQDAKEPWTVDKDQVLFVSVYLDPANVPKEIMLQWNDGTWEHRAYWGENSIDWGQDGSASRKRMGDLPAAGQWVRLEVPAADVGLNPGAKINGWAFTQFDGTVFWDQAGIVRRDVAYASLAAWEKDQQAAGGDALPKPIQEALKVDGDKRSSEQQQQLRDYFLEHVYAKMRDQFQTWHANIEQAQKEAAGIESTAPTTLVFRERKEPRKAYILDRGEYDRQRDEVQRELPKIFPPMPEGAPNNRLGLAMWLVAPNHPLTARVTVNRMWQQLFGVGLVKTADDFGSQGEMPSHPALLDYLAVQFMEDGWDVKKMMKQMVMSATYQQTSHVPPAEYQRDPGNRLLARGPRFRLDAEMLRDQALAISGLLIDKMGGPSVKPPQPDGLWFAVGYSGSNTVRFQADTGSEKVHRRTLYTFIKRTAPPPQLSTFDAPLRESCSVRRERTNTPLQALLLMNDPQYFECARALGERTMREGGVDSREQAAWMFQQATCRLPDDEELEELVSTYQDHLAHFRQEAEAAKSVIQIGEGAPDEKVDAAQWAAWTMVGNLVLNLDEVVSKN